MRMDARSLKVVSIVLVMLCVGSQSAQAQSTTNTSHVYSFGGWNLVEILDDSGQVMGFWGIPRVEVAVGNIRRLWFESIPNDDWAVWAFEPVAIYDKANNLILNGASDTSIAFLMYQESLAADTAINQSVDGGIDGLVVKGFLSGDPLTDAAGALADPDPMIDLLADIGYPVAPGMSDLLVDGTAGASVGMNQATKETLDCMRSTSSVCAPCVCVRAERMVTLGPWTVYQNNMPDGRIRCEYSRLEHHLYWQWGEDPDNNCVDCTEGSAENPIAYDVVIERTEYWYDIENCPDSPAFP